MQMNWGTTNKPDRDLAKLFATAYLRLTGSGIGPKTRPKQAHQSPSDST